MNDLHTSDRKAVSLERKSRTLMQRILVLSTVAGIGGLWKMSSETGLSSGRRSYVHVMT